MRLKNIPIIINTLLGIKNGGHLGNSIEALSMEKSLATSLSMVGVIFSAVFIIVSFFRDFSLVLKVLIGISFITYLAIFYYSKKIKQQNIAFLKWFMVLSTIVFINFIWIFNHRSQGSILYLFFLLYGYAIFMMSNKQLIYTTLLIVANIGTLFFLEYGNYLPPLHNPGGPFQINDTYLTVLLYLAIAFSLMKIVKDNYMREYNKALESDRLKTAFLANISHEIRTPLNAIIGFGNLLATEELTMTDRKNCKAIINQNNKLLLGLVNDILDISMIESNNVQRDDRIINLNLIMSDLQKAYLNILAKLGKDRIRLIKNVPEGEVLITIDENYLERALRHLLDNAVKFTDKGEIEFGFSVADKFIRFFVKDTGIGIKEKDKENLFKRFSKFEYSKEKFQAGTGIGLYLVKLIVKMFGGDVSAKSTFGKGSTFSFTVPAKDLKIAEG